MGRKYVMMLLAAEVILLIVVLLADFGVIPSNVDPLSTRSITMHLSIIIIIVGSLIAIRRAGKK